MKRAKVFQGSKVICVLMFLALFPAFFTPAPVHAKNFLDVLDEATATLGKISDALDTTFGGPTAKPKHPASKPSTEPASGGSSTPFIDNLFGGLGKSYEKTIGENGHESLKKDPGFYKNSKMLTQLGRVARRLVPTVERQDLTYHFTILNSDELNAFALPGGYVYVTKGLMKAISSDDELAGVVGHELGHVNKEHGIKQAGKAGLMTLVIALMGTNDKTKKFQTAAAIAALFANLKFSRDDEFEADKQAVKYTMKAGYKPDGIITFFNRINKDNKLTSITKYLSTHPPTTERIAKVKSEILKKGGKLSAETTAPVQASKPPSVLNPNPPKPAPTSTSKPTSTDLKAAYEAYLFAKSQYEYKVSQGAPVEEVMASFKKYQEAKERYFKLKDAAGS